MPQKDHKSRAKLAARCHEIQTCLTNKNVPEFETIIEIGMAVRLALHIRGLPQIPYEVLKLVASHYLEIPSIALDRIVKLLADVEFVKLQSTGSTINAIFPQVPFYEDTYNRIGLFAHDYRKFSEAEQLAVRLVDRLAESPRNSDSLRDDLGAEAKLFRPGIDIGTKGGYLVQHRCRGRDILINPTYFSENSEIFADFVAKSGSQLVKSLIETVKQTQGWPLSLIEKTSRIGGIEIARDQIILLKRLAQDGIIKPPSIETPHAGENYFIFTPAPPGLALNPTKREIYEKALAIVSAVRQGQLLPKQYRIERPDLLIARLRSDLRIRSRPRPPTNIRILWS